MQSFRLGDVLDEVSKYAQMALQAQQKENKVELVSRISDVGDIEVRIDSDRVIQALRNVINNAIKLTETGQIAIEANVFPDRAAFEIRIADTGPGIHSEVMPKLFGKFVAGSGSRGTGIGLYISKSIVEAHGGQIHAVNNPDGAGATFVIKMPVKSN